MPLSDLPVIIIGAGVSGLALANGLQRAAIPFRVFERHNNSNAQGHRFRISTDGIVSLQKVLSPSSQKLFNETAAQRNPWHPRYVDVVEGYFPPPVSAHNADSMPIDRTWIRQLLMLDVERDVTFNTAFSSYEEDADGVDVWFQDGTRTRGSLLVGADGINSRVRTQLQPDRRLLDLERIILWGRSRLTDDLRGQLSHDTLSWFMGRDDQRNIQFVVEPMIWDSRVGGQPDGRLPVFEDYIYWCVSAGRNCCQLQDTPKTEEENVKFLRELSENWEPQFQLILQSASQNLTRCVPVLSSRPDLELPPVTSQPRGPSRKVTLAGDAAHPMSPMGGAGADTALRSAASLVSALLAEQNDSLADALAAFEEAMTDLAVPKLERAFENGKKFWQGRNWSEYAEAGS